MIAENGLTTNRLIEGCIARNRQSQQLLYKLYADKMYAICLRYFAQAYEAQEVLQEGFIKVFDSIHQYKHEELFESWLRKIMVNSALQKFKTNSPSVPMFPLNETANYMANEENIFAGFGAKELIKMVQLLPPAYRLVFNLYVFEGMKHKEIACKLHIAEGTSKSNLNGARILLQKALAKSQRENRANRFG